jgi:hypothetical protein
LAQSLTKDKKHFAVDLKAGLAKEAERLDVDGAAVDIHNINFMESKGLGDSIEKFTKATGIKKLANKIPGGCGCNKRREALNKIFPYKNK